MRFARNPQKSCGTRRTVEVEMSTSEESRATMGTDDKVENSAQEFAGKAKEAFGKATNNDEVRAEGQADQTKANLKQAGEHVKDALK